MKPILSASASPSQLLVDLLCSPTSMHGGRLFAIARDLHVGTPTKAISPAQAQAALDSSDDDELWPWEEPLFTVENGIAIVCVRGTLVKGYDDFTCWCWGLASLDRLSLTISELATRDDVAAVVLDIDSPGGMVMGTPEFGEAIVALSAQKLVIGFTSGMACSAAYWTAAGCKMILCTKSSMVGSIGVVWPIYDYSEYFAEMGIKVDVFKRGTYKGMGITGTSLTDEQRKLADEQVGRMYDQFVSFVTSRRGEIAESTMQGQSFDGEQAVQLGLADRVVSGLPEVLAELRSTLNAALSTALSP